MDIFRRVGDKLKEIKDKIFFGESTKNLLSDFENEEAFDVFIECLQLSNELFDKSHRIEYGNDSGVSNGRPAISQSSVIVRPFADISLLRNNVKIDLTKNKYSKISYKILQKNKIFFYDSLHSSTETVKLPFNLADIIKYKPKGRIQNLLKIFNNLDDLNNLENSLIELCRGKSLVIGQDKKEFRARNNRYFYGNINEGLYCEGDINGIGYFEVILPSGERLSFKEYKYLKENPEMWAFI